MSNKELLKPLLWILMALTFFVYLFNVFIWQFWHLQQELIVKFNDC